MQDDIFSAEERSELDANPIGTITNLLDDRRFRLRHSIAKKLWKEMRNSDWAKSEPAAVLAAYDMNPPYKFYDSSMEIAMWRIYSVAETADGNLVYEVASAHVGLTNLVVGGIPIHHTALFAKHGNWSRNDALIISLCGRPASFFDPCGWLDFVKDHHARAKQ